VIIFLLSLPFAIVSAGNCAPPQAMQELAEFVFGKRARANTYDKKPTKIQKIIRFYKLNAVKHSFYSENHNIRQSNRKFWNIFQRHSFVGFLKKKDKKYIYYVYIVYVYKIENKAVILRVSYGYVAVILR
jgi:hypothetical protein